MAVGQNGEIHGSGCWILSWRPGGGLLGAGIVLGHRGSDGLKTGAGVDGGALALGMDIQNIHAQEPLSIRLGVLWSGRSYDATFGLDVLFGAVLDIVGEGLASVETRKQCGAYDWGGSGPVMSGGYLKKFAQHQQKIKDGAFRACVF